MTTAAAERPHVSARQISAWRMVAEAGARLITPIGEHGKQHQLMLHLMLFEEPRDRAHHHQH